MTTQPPSPQALVADAIQDLAATRLGRGFRPLAMLFVLGAVGMVSGVAGAFWVASGALVSGGALLASAMRTVQRSIGRPERFWMSFVDTASLAPPLYGVILVAWRGLRGMAIAGGPVAFVSAILHVVLGVWVLRCWVRVIEIEQLARVMVLNVDSAGEEE